MNTHLPLERLHITTNRFELAIRGNQLVDLLNQRNGFRGNVIQFNIIRNRTKISQFFRVDFSGLLADSIENFTSAFQLHHYRHTLWMLLGILGCKRVFRRLQLPNVF